MTRIAARLGAGVLSVVLGMIVILLLYFSLPLFHGEVAASLFSTVWDPSAGHYGLVPMIAGSLAIASLATLLATLLSLSVALWADRLPPGRMRRVVYRLFLLFGAVPTVVYGLIGVLLLVPLVRSIWTESSGLSLVTAAAMLALVVTPTMTLFFLDSFRSTPSAFTSLVSALGGRTIQYQLYVLLPYHRRSIGAGVALGLARAMGDTMIALMLAGNSIQIPHRLTDTVRTLTAHIALLFAGDFDSMAFRSIFAAGLILLLLSAGMLGLIRRLRGERHA